MSNVSPYTRVIAECLHSLSEDKPDDCACDTKQVMQLLINMLQGRMLEHIKERVSSYYKIEQDALNEEFSRNGSKTERSINQLFLSIFCKYFEYKNIEKIISTLQSDPRIQRAIISANPATTVANSAQFPELSRSSV